MHSKPIFDLLIFGRNGYEQPAYDVEGEITWFLTQSLLPDEQVETLKDLRHGIHPV